jgi:capsular exopolysaccharide synthesis family protein
MSENIREKESEINILDILNVLWKNIILIAIITVCVTIVGFVYTFAVVDEKYESKATFVVAVNDKNSGTSSSTSDYDLTNSLRLVQTVATLVTEDIVIDDVAAAHNLTSKELTNMVSVSYSSSSFLISVSVENTDKELSKELANELVQQLISVANNNDGFEFIKGTLTQTSYAKTGEYSSPNKPLYILVSILGGIVLGIIVVVIKEFCSTKFKTVKEVENDLDLKVIGYFPDDKSKGKKLLDKNAPRPVATLVEPSVRNYEPFNKLLTNIKYSNIDNPYRVIMLTSSHEGELKSTTTVNLAGCINYNNKKVVVIDLDIRRPVDHKVFKVSKDIGLLEYLEGTCKLEDIIKHTEAGVDVITSGKKVFNPLAVIEHPKLSELVKQLRDMYDYVLVDAPPVQVGSDACSISKFCDGVIFNVAMKDVNKKEAVAALQSLRNVQATIIGVNVTKAPADKHSSNYYYNNSYYYSDGHTSSNGSHKHSGK